MMEPIKKLDVKDEARLISGCVGERREWIKPIMFSGGLGSIDANYITKEKPGKGMLVVKVGGPIYRVCSNS